jgi:hypothetical protein
MKTTQVKLGGLYEVKVSGRMARVRVLGTNPLGGYDGRNEETGRAVRLRSARRLRRLLAEPGTSAREAREQEAGRLRDQLHRLDGTEPDGSPCVIYRPRDMAYLSGNPYLFSSSHDRAYVLGERTAEKLVEAFPLTLEGARIIVRRAEPGQAR